MISLLMIVGLSFASERISSIEIDRGVPLKIHMNPGKTTTLDLPCAVSYALPGAFNDLKIEIGPDKDSSLVLWLTSTASSPTNLVIRCDEKVVVFDVLPNRQVHQDYIHIKKIFDKSSQQKRELISDSKSVKENSEHRKKQLIFKSEDK